MLIAADFGDWTGERRPPGPFRHVQPGVPLWLVGDLWVLVQIEDRNGEPGVLLEIASFGRPTFWVWLRRGQNKEICGHRIGYRAAMYAGSRLPTQFLFETH